MSHKLNFNWNFRLQFILARKFYEVLDKALKTKVGKQRGWEWIKRRLGFYRAIFRQFDFLPNYISFGKTWQTKKQRINIHSKMENELSFVFQVLRTFYEILSLKPNFPVKLCKHFILTNKTHNLRNYGRESFFTF